MGNVSGRPIVDRISRVLALSGSAAANRQALVLTQARRGRALARTLAAAAGPDVTAPTITSASSVSQPENAILNHTLTANEAVTWTKTGGADTALFSLAGSTLTLAAKNFEAPADANTDNAYVVQVTATDGSGNATNQTITVTITDVDEIAPTITSSATPSVAENSAFSHSLTANETVTWTKTGGADQALFSLAGSTLSMTARDYELPTDADTNNVYLVQVTATDTAGNATVQNISVTVTDVAEGGGSAGTTATLGTTQAIWPTSQTPTGVGTDFTSITLGGKFEAQGPVRISGFRFYWDGINNTNGASASHGWGVWTNAGVAIETHTGLAFGTTSGWIDVTLTTPLFKDKGDQLVMGYYAAFGGGNTASFGHVNAVNPQTVGELKCLESRFVEVSGLSYPSSNFNSQDYMVTPLAEPVDYLPNIKVQQNGGFHNHSATSFSPALSTAATVGNLITVAIASGGYLSADPTGWTLLSSDGNTGNFGSRVYGRIATGSDACVCNMGGSYNAAWAITEWAFVPITVLSQACNHSAFYEGNLPTMTPTSGKRLQLAVLTNNFNATSNDTSPAGTANQGFKNVGHGGINAGGGSGAGIEAYSVDVFARYFPAADGTTGYVPTFGSGKGNPGGGTQDNISHQILFGVS